MEKGPRRLAISLIEYPRVGVGDVGGVAPEFENGEYVALDGIADHEELGRLDLVALQDARVGRGVFFGHDLEIGEMGIELGKSEFARLVPQIPFGDDQHAVTFTVGKGGDGLGHAGENFDGVIEHVVGEGDDLADLTGRNVTATQLNGRFNGRKREALDAVAVAGQVAMFGAVECRVDFGGVVVTCEQCAESTMGGDEEGLVVPKGVVCIKCDYFWIHTKKS